MASMRSTRAVVFCDIVSSTEVRGRLGDTRADAWFAGLLAQIEAAVVDVDGVVVKALGDGVMAVFTSAGDALDAAVAMQQGTHAYGRRAAVEAASLRVGVSIGDVATTGDDWNGMPVVQAARLCSAARPDEILAADIVRILAGSRCSVPMVPAGDYQLKGIDEPVAVVRVEWTPIPNFTTADLPASLDAARRGPFVGRAPLVADLYDTWKSKEWRTLLVAGEPGIGKTRLVAELAHRMHDGGCTVAVGRCDDELSVSYRPWVEALGPVVDGLGSDVFDQLPADHIGELCRLIPSMARRFTPPNTDLVVDADTRHAMVVDAVIALLGIAGPLAIVLDDMHWIDQRSLQLFRRVVAADLPDLAIIGTYRDTDLDRLHPLTATLADLRRMTGIRRVALSGLDGSAVVEFLEHSAGHALDTDGLTLARAVHARTAGNPLFVGELLRHLADTGAIAFVDRRWTGGPEPITLPEGLREVIGRRLTSLGTDTIRVLQVAAAIGTSFDVGVVEDVAGSGAGDGLDVLTCVERAQAAGIVVDTGRLFEFRHAVIRDVLLADLSAARRQRLHRDLLVVLEQRWALTIDNHLEELAYHHAQARSPRAAAWNLRAAEAAIASLDVGAVALADRGLALLDVADPVEPTLRCDLLIARATAARLTGAETIDDARLAFTEAVELGDQERIGRALLSVSLRSTAASHIEHLDFLSQGLKLLDDTTLITRWNTEVALIVREFMNAETDPRSHRDRVRVVVDHLDPADTVACQIAMRCARSLTSTNQPHDALPITERFNANCDGVDTEGFPVEIALSTMWLHLGDRDASDRYLAAAADDPRRSYWFFDCQVLQRQVMRDMLDGDWAAAAEGIAEEQRIGGHDENIALSALAQTSWLRSETGDLDTNYVEVRDYAAALPDFAILRALLVREAAESGRHDEARVRLDELAPDDFAGVGRGWLTLMGIGNLAWAAVTVGAAQHAATLQDLLTDYKGQIAVMATGTHVLCAVDRLRAGLAALDGHHADADQLFADALAQDRALRSRPLEARTLHWWGRALHQRGDSRLAAELLVRARTMADELTMRALVQQIDHLTLTFA